MGYRSAAAVNPGVQIASQFQCSGRHHRQKFAHFGVSTTIPF
jgi:hypothetical protein